MRVIRNAFLYSNASRTWATARGSQVDGVGNCLGRGLAVALFPGVNNNDDNNNTAAS